MKLSAFDKLSSSFVPKGSRVLDLGCADGKIGEFMEKYFACKVTGVEINPSLAQIAARRLTKVIIGDLENPQIQAKILKQGKFEVLFASGILEHLKNPQQVLENLKPALKSNSVMIITLPNIAFWRMRFELLFGRFEYTDSGILDKGHLRLFTIKSARVFIEKDCHLTIDQVDFDFPIFPLIHRFFKIIPFGENLQAELYRTFPQFFAYQMVLKCRQK